jgi:hypothetical protein
VFRLRREERREKEKDLLSPLSLSGKERRKKKEQNTEK